MKLHILLLAALLAPSFSVAEVKYLPLEVREQLFQSASSAKIVRSTKDIPATVMQACTSIAYQGDFRMANPGEKFEATDFILDDTLPQRRLIWVARVPHYYLLHYEHGGIGLHQHVVVVSYSDPKSAKVIWSGFSQPLKDYQEFLEALKADKLYDAKAGKFQETWHL